MPVFTAIAGSIVGATALTGIAATIATNVVAIGLLVGTSQLLGLDEVGGQAGVVDEGVDVRLGANTQNRLPLLYGDFQSRGIVCYYTLSNDKQSLTTVLALGEGPITSIDEVLWEDYTLTLDANGVVTNATRLVGTETETTDKYNGKISVQLNPAGGRSTFLEGITTDWTAAHTMSNIAYVIVSIDYDRDAGLTGLADMRFRGTGAVDNPAIAVRNLLQNTVYGVGLADSAIDIPSFDAAEAYFNELVSFNNDTEMQKRSRLNGVLNTGDEVSTRVGTILEGCNSSLRWYNGQWGLFIDKVDTATTFVFSPDNIVGQMRVVETGLTNLYNRVIAEYGRGVENNYQRATIELESPASVLYPNELERTLNLSLPLINNSTEAAAVATVILNKGRQQLTVSHRADVTAMPLEPGDVVRYNDADYGWVNKLFRVISVSEIYEDGALSYDIQSVEYADDVYDYGVLNAHDVSPNATTPSVEIIEAVDDLIVSSSLPSIATPSINLSWTVPDNSLVNSFSIFYNIVTTSFSSSNTIIGGTEQLSVGNYSSGDTVTHELIGVPTADVVSIWVVTSNDFVSSIESNTATVNDWDPFADIAATAELVYRYNETPSVIAGVNIDVGEPPANATGTGTGRNNDDNDTGWYEFDPEASDRENAPVWTATTQATRQDAQSRIIEFTQSGVSGDIITEGTDVNQVTDFGFSGTIGNATTLYEARPSIDTFTITGDPADVNTSDAGVEPVWSINTTGTTDATVSGNSEQFFFYPQGTSSVVTPESFSFTPSGDTSNGGTSFSGLSQTVKTNAGFTSLGQIRFLVDGSRVGDNINNISYADINDFNVNTSHVEVNITSTEWVTLATALGVTDFNGEFDFANKTGTFTLSDGTNFFTVVDPIRVRSNGFVNGGRRVFITALSLPPANTSLPTAASCSLTNIQAGDTGWTLQFNDDSNSSATITLDGVENTYTLPDNLSGAAAIGASLNTLIGSDYDTGWVKTFDSTSGVVTFTADDNTDRTGSVSSTVGGGGSFSLAISNVDSSGTLTTVQFVIATESIDVTHTVPSGLTGTPLFTNIMTFLSGSTDITDEFTVDSVVTDIPGFTDVTVIRLTANDNTNHTLSTTISSGMTGSLSGSLLDGNEASTATTINISYDSVLMPVQQNITFGSNTTPVEIAAELTTAIDGHAELVATQGTVVVETTARVSYFQSNFGFDTVSTTFTEDLTEDVVLLKSSLKQVLAVPILTVTTQGTGTATFAVNERLAGRVPTAGNPMPAFTTVDIIANGQVAATAFPLPDGSASTNAIVIMFQINNNVAGFSATRDGAVITVTSDTNVVDRLSLIVNTGVNAPGRLDGNDLASSRTQVNIGSPVDVTGGQATLVSLAIGGTTYYSNTYNGGTLEDIIDDLVIGLNTVDNNFVDRFAGLKTDSVTLRATAEFLGDTPMITAAFTDGSTATADSIGNVTTVNSALGISNTEITPGDELVILSGELSTFSVTQGTTALITDMEITGASTAAEVSTQIIDALTPLSNLEYEVISSDNMLTAASLNSVAVPTLTITIDAGLNTDNTVATITTAKVITQMEAAGDLNLTDVIWEYAVTSPTTDGDTTMITPDGTIAVRRGLFLNSLAASRDSLNTNNNEVIFGNDLYTTSASPSLLDITGVAHCYISTTVASDASITTVFAQMQYTDDVDDLDNATWSSITGTVSNSAVAQTANATDPLSNTTFFVSLSFASDDFEDLAVSTQYAFRVVLQAFNNDTIITVPNNVLNGVSATFQLQEILTT